MTANTPASRKAKGRRLQQAVRQDLIDRLGIDPGDILSTAMGQSGCDLYLSPAARSVFPFGVECKAQERIALPEWWQQCTRNAAAEGLVPLLVFKRNREEPLAVLRWEDLLALLSWQDSRWQNLAEGLTGGRP
ncbi:putative PDDEXK endonuclease [Candidatus Darwinibacter acetoxidans]